MSNAIDETTLLANFEGLEDVLSGAITDFESLAPGWLADVRAALNARNAEQLVRAAHAMKGASSNFHAGPTMKAAQALEAGARVNDLTQGEVHYQQLEKALEELLRALSQLKTKLNG